MRLNVKHKKSLTKTDKQKKADARKKSKGPKLLDNYTDNSDFELNNVELDITQMRYGTIDSCNVDFIKLSDDIIKITGSWIGLIIFMLDNIYINNKDNFIDKLCECQVTNMFLSVDKVYGKYSFDKYQYKAYKILDSGYYLEIVETSEVIFNALVNIIQCLELQLDAIKFHLINKEYCNLLNNFNRLEHKEYIVCISDLDSMIKKGIHMVSVDILGKIENIHSIEVALVAILNILIDEFGEDNLKKITSNNGTGLKEIEDSDYANNNIVRIKDSNLCVYTDFDIKGIKNFLLSVEDTLNIQNKIRFKFRALKDKSELKEWEVE